MKMISSAKLRRAEGALRMMNPYRNQLSSVISHLLSSDGDFPSPLTEVRSVSRIAFVVIGSEEGLCGAYNVYLFKKLIERIEYVQKTYGEDCKITILQFRNFFKKEKDTGRLPSSCRVNSSMDYLLFGLFPAPFKFQGDFPQLLSILLSHLPTFNW